MNELQNLLDAIVILEQAKKDTCRMPTVIYKYPMHASAYLQKQVVEYLTGE